MRSSKISGTYMYLYDYILSDLIYQICYNFKYCFRNDDMPYIIGEKFEEYRNYVKLKMKRREIAKLDRHKVASCLCGAIIDAKPLIECDNLQPKRNVNELLGLYTGLNVIKHYMIYTYVFSLNLPSENKNDICRYLKEKYDMRFPDFNENICDAQKYEYNLINSLQLTHKQCKITKHECFCYDIWAYAKIYYHLELYNKPYFESFLQDYIKISSN